MKIVADENIPLVEHYFSLYGELVLKSGRDITHTDLIDADILLVRSVTKVNETLLKNTSVKYVGSATSGADHLDTHWLDQQNIRWNIAEGCNAKAVSEYVICVIASLKKKGYLNNQKIRAGVVGVGRIGHLVAEKFRDLGWEVVLCDPLRNDIKSISFGALTDLDIISFHTPLTRTGEFPTHHLVKNNFLKKQKKNCILLNAGRGEVFSFDALKKEGMELIWCLDVWEEEPTPDLTVLNHALIATPHIAGYSLQGKLRGTQLIYQAMLRQDIFDKNSVVSELIWPVKNMSVKSAKDWGDVLLTLFDPMLVTKEMKKHPDQFDELRKKCAERYEFAFVQLENMSLLEADVLLLEKWGFVK